MVDPAFIFEFLLMGDAHSKCLKSPGQLDLFLDLFRDLHNLFRCFSRICHRAT
jgi:hypothetical protein